MLKRFAGLLETLVAAAAILGQAAWAGNAEWPSFRGPNHDGRSLDTGLLKEWPAEGPTLVWKFDGLGRGFSSAALSGGRIFITGDVEDTLVLYAFDMNGQPLWNVNTGQAWTQDRPGARSTPAIDGDSVYLLSGTGLLGCYDAANGAVRWSKELSELGGEPGGWGYAETPLLRGDSLIVKFGGAKCVRALNKKTGDPIWASEGYSAGAEYGSCLPFTFEDVPMIVTGTRAGLVCVKEQTGEVLWTNDFSANNTANCPTPAYADGHVFWANGYGKGGICMKLESGGKASVAWTTQDMDCHHGGYIIEQGYIYGDNGDGISCLDLRTGEVKWKHPALGKGSLCWADGMLYLYSERNGRAALATCSPDGMEIKGQVQVEGKGPSWAHPVVVGGRLYLRYDTTLYCFDVKAK
ncbi:MAG: PQQ-like beta-propeller repeat protein [Candidatus Hydrogenedentes bacterium]|nr:PQQ-like beta-propeller repeat protein [Candidatus Hydrogenedentota bacterium]